MTELTQLPNQLEIIGRLKAKDLEERVSTAGVRYISGFLTVTSKINGEIHDFKVNVFSMNTERSEKTFKGLQTVLDTYKDSRVYGEDADTIKVNGTLKFVQFINSYGEKVQYNEIKGNFFNRVDSYTKHSAVLGIGVVVEELLSNNNQLEIKGFNVAYNEEVVNLMNMTVDSSVEEIIKEYYSRGQTGVLTCSLKCPTNETEQTRGFGVVEYIQPLFTEFSELELHVVGGNLPYVQGKKKYNENMIVEAKKKLEEKLQAKASA